MAVSVELEPSLESTCDWPSPGRSGAWDGATLSKLTRHQVSVTALVLSMAEQSLPEGFSASDIQRECPEAPSALGLESKQIVFCDFPVRRFLQYRQEILELLVQFDREYEPDLVFCPSLTDTHQDHQVVSEDYLRAFRSRSVFGYELPWNNHGFSPSVSNLVTLDDVNNKELSLSCCVTQNSKPYFKPRLLEDLARLRASVTHSEFAESFDVIRAVIQ